MFLRDILKRWSERPLDATTGDGTAASCRPALSLLAELATDSEDFADLAAVLQLDLDTVVETLVTAAPESPTALVATLTARSAGIGAADAAATPVVQAESTTSFQVGIAGIVDHGTSSAHSPTPAATSEQSSWGEGGWGRWTRARGGARVHRRGAEHASVTPVRPAAVAP